QPQDQWQEIILIVRWVRFHGLRQCVLSAKAHIVNRLDATDPVACRVISMSLLIILPSGKIPEKIPRIHMPDLITEEKAQVVRECGTLILGKIQIAAVILLVSGIPITIYPGENGFAVK